MEVFPEDQGQYICVAENPAGQATTSSYLTIIESEETTMELEPQAQDQVDATVPQGQEVTFTLAAPLAPEPMETEEKPVQEEVVLVSEAAEEEVVPTVIDRPKVEPLVKEERMAESPVFESPIPESLTGTETSDSYYTAQEEVDEEVTEPSMMAKVIDRTKVVPLVPEKIPESPEREIIPLEVDIEEEIPESVTPTEEAVEDLVEKVTTTRELKLPEFPEEKKPEEEAPVIMQETTVEEVTTQSQEVTFVLPAAQIDEDETEVKVVIPESPVEEVRVHLRRACACLTILITISFELVKHSNDQYYFQSKLQVERCYVFVLFPS